MFGVKKCVKRGFLSGSLLKIFAILAVFAALASGLIYYNFYSEKSPITDFVYERDTADILKIFDKDWYWLVNVTREEYSPEFMLQHKTPFRDPASFGRLTIKVLRDENKLAGFTAYYKENSYKGRLLYVAVDSAFRGKGYGEQLASYAVKNLFASGCNVVILDTRTDNVRARALYKKLGFSEMVEGGYVHCTKYKK